MFAACDDDIVPYEQSSEVAKLIEADFVTIPGGGHFYEGCGYYDFPELLPYLAKAIGHTSAGTLLSVIL